MMHWRVPIGFLTAFFAIGLVKEKADVYEPSANYRSRQIQGWTILIHPALFNRADSLESEVFALLDQQLYQVTRKIPKAALAKLRTVKIWLEVNEPHHPCMVYHPDPEWLTKHEMNPDKGRCVEIANAERFLSWSLEQPWMVLHELAHAYHHQFLPEGFDNGLIRLCFKEAKASGRYESVLRINGRQERAYALSDPMEYFAEGSEAFFGTNDFYPFVRAELRKHDPQLERTLHDLWSSP